MNKIQSVLLSTREFNNTPINDAKCRAILADLLLILNNNITISNNDATDVFFKITKLFLAKNPSLRQITCLAIKELSSLASDVIIVTSSLTKDMNVDSVYRPNAIRALCHITDASLIQGIERFVKQAIVDKSPAVASAALVNSFRLYHLNKDIVKRWLNEISESLNSKSYMTQYHALGLLHLIKHNDNIAIMKLIQQCQKLNVRPPYAHCLIIRYATKLILEEQDLSLVDMLRTYLTYKSEMVVYEAARSLCSLPNLPPKALSQAVSSLQLFLVNHKATMRFAAIRTLNKLALTHPEAVSPCNLDIETLITDPTRSVAIFAITTLLKTGTEVSVDRLMKQINSFMSDITDELKIVIVDAIRSLCLKFPAKHPAMLAFLSTSLRDEGSYEFKKAIVDAIFDIVENIPESKEIALAHLCEFIEDCEFVKLCVRILYLLGTQGPTTSDPGKYIRYIYNRIILENSVVRAAAVSSLAKIGISVPSLQPRIKLLLQKCLNDADDEVRDRATFYLGTLNVPEIFDNENLFVIEELEDQLLEYLTLESFSTEFDIRNVRVMSKEEEMKIALKKKEMLREAMVAATPAVPAQEAAVPVSYASEQKKYEEQLSQIPSLAALGSIMKSSRPVELTENDVEYVVKCVKHLLPGHIVFQFDVKNTVQDMILANVIAQMSFEEECDGLKPCFALPILSIPYGEVGTGYVVFERLEKTPIASFGVTLHYLAKECDSQGNVDGEYEDEYAVESVALEIGDYLKEKFVDYDAFTETRDGQSEAYALSVASVKDAVASIIQQLSLKPVKGSDNVADNATVHALYLTGHYVPEEPVCVRCRFAFDGSTVNLEITCWCDDVAVREAIPDNVC